MIRRITSSDVVLVDWLVFCYLTAGLGVNPSHPKLLQLKKDTDPVQNPQVHCLNREIVNIFMIFLEKLDAIILHSDFWIMDYMSSLFRRAKMRS